jgi:hypothetical protein
MLAQLDQTGDPWVPPGPALWLSFSLLAAWASQLRNVTSASLALLAESAVASPVADITSAHAEVGTGRSRSACVDVKEALRLNWLLADCPLMAGHTRTVLVSDGLTSRHRRGSQSQLVEDYGY